MTPGGEWRPGVYLQFADDRLRPGFDLMARIGDLPPGPLYDIGCGAGQHARALADRWPDRPVFGLDSSPQMLAAARAARNGAAGDSRVQWVQADAGTWQAPPPAPALLFSNAALQWLDGHQALLTRLFDMLAPGGVLAVQMPRNDASPSQVLLREVAAQGPWAEVLKGARLLKPLGTPDTYYGWLAAAGARQIDLWESHYVHVLQGDDPVFDWVKSTSLRPVLERLSCALLDGYVNELKARLRTAYPRRTDGTTLFPFRRLFFVCRRPA